MSAEQLHFAFASLDFPGRVSLRVEEVAHKLGLTVRHVTSLIVEGKLIANDFRGRDSGRACYRIPIEAYRDYVSGCVTSPVERLRLLRDLPRATLIELQRELKQLLVA